MDSRTNEQIRTDLALAAEANERDRVAHRAAVDAKLKQEKIALDQLRADQELKLKGAMRAKYAQMNESQYDAAWPKIFEEHALEQAKAPAGWQLNVTKMF